jgi:nucleotide-binding universal stress UspA family protein
VTELKKLAWLGETSQFPDDVTQGYKQMYTERIGMLHAVLKVESFCPKLQVGSYGDQWRRTIRQQEYEMKILLAVDGSDYSDAAIEEVLRRPWPSQSEIKAITAYETPIMVGMEPWAATPSYFDQLDKAAREGAKALIDRALEKLKTIQDTSLKISSGTIQGPPRQVIVEEAERWGADLIIMGSRGLGAWNRLLLGSVSSAVVHHAKCSVEIVRGPQAP